MNIKTKELSRIVPAPTGAGAAISSVAASIGRCVLFVLSFAVSGGCLAQGNAPTDYRGIEIPRDGSFAWVSTAEGAKWPNAQLKWFYNPAGQPSDLTTEQIVAIIQKAMAKWSAVCNISFPYQGTTTAIANVSGAFDKIDGIPVVTWLRATGEDASYGGMALYWYQNGIMVDADMVINTAHDPPFGASNIPDLEALVGHEVGHMLGISHSNVAQSVMFANPYNSYKSQLTLRGDDVAACQQTYGPSATANDNRVFNFAEVTYEQYFAPVGGVSGTALGYVFRFYPGTNSYIGTKDGNLSILLPGGGVTVVGKTSDFLPQAINAGF